jgi:cbb3-type cytochrome oxidase maturation protein
VEILLLLIPLALVLTALVIWGFFWAVRSDQFEDLEGPAYSILMEDDHDLVPPATDPDQPPAPY